MKPLKLIESNCLLKFLFFLILNATLLGSNAQDSVIPLKIKSIAVLNDKAVAFNKKIDKQTIKYLNKILKQENKIRQKIEKMDSSLAKQVFNNMEKSYNDFKEKITSKSKIISKITNLDGINGLDSLTNSLKFLKNANSNIAEVKDKLNKTIANFDDLKTKFSSAKELKKFINERKELLKTTCEKFKINAQFKKFNKAAYYYTEQIREYKEAWKDPNKMEQKIISLVRKLPAFENFVQQNNLSRLFPNTLVGNQNIGIASFNGGNNIISSTVTSYSGLQSRMTLQQVISQRIAAGSTSSLNSQFNESINHYNQIKFKKESVNSNSKKAIGFKPNTQKTKPFKERLFYLFDVQLGKGAKFFPKMGNLGLQAGYKFNDEVNIGLGLAYQCDFGTGWNSIKFKSNSLGFRSFFEYKTIKTLYARFGAEANYTLHDFTYNNFLIKQNWNKSVLFGASKKIAFKGKIASIQLMYDFLYKQKLPQNNPLVYRISYHF